MSRTLNDLKNSTTVRTFVGQTLPRWIARQSPPLARRLAVELFRLTPERRRPKDTERRTLASAKTGLLTTPRGAHVRYRAWGRGPTVIGVHGWGGRGGQFHRYVRPLLNRGYRVVAFDAPGHGDSPGRRSDLVLMAEALTTVAKRFPPHAIIAHSLGAAAAGLAMRDGLDVERLILVSPSLVPSRYPLDFLKNTFDFGTDDIQRTQLAFEARVGRRLEDTSTLDNLTAHPPKHLLLIHDTGDTITPLEPVERLAQTLEARASLTTTEGLGHYRILGAPVTIDATTRFLGQAAARPSLAEVIERELWDPQLRRREAAF